MASTEIKAIQKNTWTNIALDTSRLNLYCFNPEGTLGTSTFSVEILFIPVGESVEDHLSESIHIASTTLLYYDFKGTRYDIYLRYNSLNGKCRVIGDW